MKSKIKLIGIIASVVIIVFSFVSCGDSGDGGNSGNNGNGTIAVTGVSLDKSTLSIVIGASETLTATVAPNNATNKSVTWSSSNASVATVSGGTVKAVSVGSAVITVTTVSGSRTASCSVIVTPASSPVQTFNSLDEFSRWFSGQPANTTTTPYNVKLNVSSISGIADILRAVPRNYVSLDLSSSSITAILKTDFRSFSWGIVQTLTGIILPNSVTSIEEGTFESFQNLASVSIGNGVTSIGNDTFLSCTSLANLTIGNSVTSIGESAFQYCSKLTSVTIPNSVRSIGDSAFNFCTNISSLTLGNNLTSIGSYAFSLCGYITSITIPSSVTSIGEYALTTLNTQTRDYSLTSVTFQGTIPSSGFGSSYSWSTTFDSPFYGDLRDKFYATDPNNGTPGTYTRNSGTTLWWKQ